MILCRAELKPEALHLDAFRRRLFEGGGAHALVWSLFADDPARTRDFLWRQEGDGLATRFYTLSGRAPEDRLGLWKLEARPFEPKLVAGDRLSFSVRVNPTVAKMSDEDVARGRTRGRRHDVVMEAKRAARSAGAPSAELVQEYGLRWLLARAPAHGFAVAEESVRVDGYRQHRLRRKPAKGGEASFSTLDIEGVLAVSEPEAFVSLLRTGLGPAKAFGCGLMLVRRV